MHMMSWISYKQIHKIRLLEKAIIKLCRVAAWDGCLAAACISFTLQEYNSNSYAISDTCTDFAMKLQ